MHADESGRPDPVTLPPDLAITVTGGAAGLGNLRRLQRGHGDPTLRSVGQNWWRASTTPEGEVLAQLRPDGNDVRAELWGPGSAWAGGQLSRLLGCHDSLDWVADWSGHPLVAPLLRRPPLPLGATDLIDYELAASVIEQKVTGVEAFSSLRTLLFQIGRPAPGPATLAQHPAEGMICPPTADQWRDLPRWSYLQAGVDERRSRALVGAMTRLPALTRLVEAGGDVTTVGERLGAGLGSLPGIGPWTAAKLRQAALGDPDAWTIDDYHVPGRLAAALGGSQPEMAAELMEQFRPHRYRIELLLLGSGLGARQRRGPRRSLPVHLPHDFGRSSRHRGNWNH